MSHANRHLNSLLSLSLWLALAIIYLEINYSDSIPIGSLLESASESDSKSNELKMSNIKSHVLTDKAIHGLLMHGCEA